MSSAYENVIAHPSSIAARRELAREWRDQNDPRVELLDRQLRRHDGLPVRSGIPLEITQLIEKHGHEWAGRVGELARSVTFKLGLVSGISMAGDAFLSHAEELFRLMPIIAVGLKPPLDVPAILACPQLAQLKGLYLDDETGFGDHEAKQVAQCPRLAGLKVGAFGGNIGIEGLRALAASPFLQQVVWLDVSENPGCPRGIEMDMDFGRGPPGLKLVRLEDGCYLNGPAAKPYWDDELERMYLSAGEGLWWPPPLDTELTFTEE